MDAYIIGAVLIIVAIIAGILTARQPQKTEASSTIPPQPIPEPPAPIPAVVPQTTLQEQLYDAAKRSLGKVMKLDSSVPNLYGCASSLSGVLKLAGVEGLPAFGIAGTAALYNWLLSSDQFVLVNQPQPGDVVISPSPATEQPNTLAHGHCGIMAAVDQGVMSNDSDTGKWMEKWTLPDWLAYYTTFGRLNIFYFRRVK